jgi:putative membrane-bound dehydrogenase-like protein
MRPLLFLLLTPVFTFAQSSLQADAVAGNDGVRRIVESFGGRGTLADDTPPSSPAEALKKFSTRPDVAVDLIAHEPEVTQPLYLSFDSRGRMWVTQYRQYQFPAGLKVVAYDQHLRAKFDQVPQPPPAGVRGADLVSVHEDTDGDGLYDKSKVVLDGLNIATAALWGNDAIWVMNPPYLLRYADANGDDVPDGDPEVALRGFGIEDTHSVASSLMWGPDGWLYGANGSTTTGNVSSATTKNVRWEGQCIWRYDPRSKRFEIYAEGGGNTFSLDIDAKGRVFSGTNHGSTRGMHYEQGSYGIKGWGKHGPLTNAYAFGWFEHMKHTGDGKRFPQAFTIYEGGLLGTQYEGFIIAPNSLRNIVYASQRLPTASTFSTQDHEDMLKSSDRWFRPVDAKSGPDGCIYLADWYDTRLSHVRPVDDWHKGSGRIYRIRPASGGPKGKLPDLHHASAKELLAALQSPNEWTRKQAASEIGWQHLDELIPPLTELALKPADPHALDALFALDQMGAVGDPLCQQLLQHPDAYVRRWAVKLVGESQSPSESSVLALAKVAASEVHPEVRTQISATAKRLPAAHCISVLAPLWQSYTGEDERQELMLWWALESISEKARGDILSLLKSKERWSMKASSRLLKNLVQRWAIPGGKTNLQSISDLLTMAPDSAARSLVLQSFASTLDGSLPEMPESLSHALTEYLKEQAGDDLALAIRSGRTDAATLKQANAQIKDAKLPLLQRAAVALALAEKKDPAAKATVESIFKSSGNEAFKRALLPAVAKLGDHKIIRTMLDGWEQRMAGDKALREAALRTMAGQPDWTKLLLSEVALWHVPTKHFTPDIVRQMSLLGDAAITAEIEKHWPGLLQAAPTAETEKEMARIRTVLQGGAGDVAKGKVQFTARCAQCHKLFGEGGELAPELTGYERGSIDFWLSNILTPSLEIREGFGAYVVKQKSGQMLMGIITQQDAKGIKLRDVANQVTELKQADIESMVASPISLMPPTQLAGMTDTDLQDLFAYLMK